MKSVLKKFTEHAEYLSKNLSRGEQLNNNFWGVSWLQNATDVTEPVLDKIFKYQKENVLHSKALSDTFSGIQNIAVHLTSKHKLKKPFEPESVYRMIEFGIARRNDRGKIANAFYALSALPPDQWIVEKKKTLALSDRH